MASTDQVPDMATAEKVLARFTEYSRQKKFPPLLQREFVTVETGAASGEIIRVMQWNMLAQALIEDTFTKCPPEALELNVRKHRIVEELLRFQPTVMCMEEVDQFSYLDEILSECGYLGTFHPKTLSPCLNREKHYGPDGCAVFFNSSQLKLVDSENICLEAKGDKTSHVAIICHFQTKASKSKDFSIIVTHLESRTGYDETRKEQALFLTKYLEGRNYDHPLLLCGDLNFPPTEPAYEVIRSSGLGLTSAYTHLSQEGEEPKYTLWTVTDKEYCKTVDYVWYTRKGLTVKSLLNMASEAEVGENRLPSFKNPSDHSSLVCDFMLHS